ncbi:uncharacterized protein LOC106877715 [Octopus bimaculoides]|uniref:Uncharacterized protein n=1 Tax=Octopus bimaculoides TaxID=37653 RepID=A0A0L8GCV0_OCTBM|nr:uncharacterized protein LOC106877715 [Octopus bimaculoides]XP_014782159.1 uncharacterized protein LOC106877715 [Octopus bimaculoides]XP_052827205.1 uncharacterized protein LOC106877715 [Octopus bimaculoides]XP_052827206.1 uncharacterized protein LOC106877715 [Octopus bimaculoides]XP_052827207.1 uncharacterized protein LOC106877715 [Octopus bimaculoides]XP_052827208.1 uncharacterized protein LOC106877715 [Octopus bimaculoides]XP_052827209.1 uncharacterized protein LOC106877715 [Octopus bima|eukprot:XP_014782157.1 PREDICTED: uncharacterized protein LOC106877715 [Octopus bimaculoides]
MSNRKKYGSVSRSEYDDTILRNNVRADNRLSRELKDVERAQKVTFRDISFETKRLRNKIQSGTAPVAKSDHLQKKLLEISREQTVSAQARTSVLHIDTNMAEYNEMVESSTPEALSQGSINNPKENTLQSNGKSKRIGITVENSDKSDYNKEAENDGNETTQASSQVKNEKRNIWDSLSIPKHSNNVKAVRQRLQSEFQSIGLPVMSSRQTTSQLPPVHGQSIKRNANQTVKL